MRVDWIDRHGCRVLGLERACGEYRARVGARMSTRASIVIRDSMSLFFFYRHSDGYPDCCGKDLAEFVKDYTSGAMRDNAEQSAGWLIIRGHQEYKSPLKPSKKDSFSGWKVGAYEPADGLHCDVEYIYTIDLAERTLTCAEPRSDFWDDLTMGNTRPCEEFKPVRF